MNLMLKIDRHKNSWYYAKCKKKEEENLCIFALYTMISTSSVIIMHNFSFWKKKKKRCANVCIICEKQERRSIDWLVFNANFSNISAISQH
jgi:hypothetical protein